MQNRGVYRWNMILDATMQHQLPFNCNFMTLQSQQFQLFDLAIEEMRDRVRIKAQYRPLSVSRAISPLYRCDYPALQQMLACLDHIGTKAFVPFEHIDRSKGRHTGHLLFQRDTVQRLLC